MNCEGHAIAGQLPEGRYDRSALMSSRFCRTAGASGGRPEDDLFHCTRCVSIPLIVVGRKADHLAETHLTREKGLAA